MPTTKEMFDKAYGRYLAGRQVISIECEAVELDKNEVKPSGSPGTCNACQCTEIPRVITK